MLRVGFVVVAAWALAACSAGARVCQKNSDCSNAYCENGQCKSDCRVSALDCNPGQFCNQIGKCQDLGDGGAPPDLSFPPGSDLAGLDFSVPPTGNDLSAPPVLKNELDLCSGDSECASSLCRPFYKNGGASRCTRSCTSHLNCPAGERCVLDATNTMTCAGEDTGRACTGGAGCNFACVNAQYCTHTCSTGSDCPNGYGCLGIGTPPQRVCVRVEALCDASDASACIAPAACDTSAALLVGGCTIVCNSPSDCPQRAAGLTPWTCDGSGICRRPPDVYGPLPQGFAPAQWACNGSGATVNVCNDAEHINFTAFTIPPPPTVSCGASMTTDGAPGDACVDSCLYQGGCAYGYACDGVGNVGAARIGLCLPALGTGEVGAGCSTDGQCAFGLCRAATGHCSRDCTLDGVCPTGSTCAAAGLPNVEGMPYKTCQ